MKYKSINHYPIIQALLAQNLNGHGTQIWVHCEKYLTLSHNSKNLRDAKPFTRYNNLYSDNLKEPLVYFSQLLEKLSVKV